ncbi:uncharacterized protein LOC129721892 [Wyeomyia smithii]|uniref:uncharacterized protein LOC129721892 n=1 Tax=Wyeomyia smithii TaxID=174621 RepID=UPI002467E934|nr:uncharacterized protein LOC129721892 [Wyeomyia smithii]
MMTYRLSGGWILILFGLLAAATDCAKTQKYREILSRIRPVVRNSYSTICPTPYFPNGMIRIRLGGKFLLFECLDGFTLIGEKYLLCRDGRWGSPAPMCIKSGCVDLPDVENGFIFYENDKAAATVFCNSEYQALGSLYSYCNGTHWDRTIGKCRRTNSLVSTSCDFEVIDWCGWTNEGLHILGWKRVTGMVSTRALKTGPKQDHTTGVPLDGHFLIADSTEHFTNDAVRLISPIYTANYSLSSCFRFFYHMYGESVGTLAVYLKPESTIPSQEQILFSISGNQGNEWKEGYFDLPEQAVSFQIVFKASLGMRFRSDIAIDDVELESGEQCVTSQRSTSVPTVTDVDEVFGIGTCNNRCGKNDSISQSVLTQCSCIDQCMDNQSCCPDFVERCLLNVLDEKNVTLKLVHSSSSVYSYTENSSESYTSTDRFEFESSTEKANVHSDGLQISLGMIALGVLILIAGITLIVRAKATGCMKSKFKERQIDALESVEFLTAGEDINESVLDELVRS